jgi:heat shock protein HtpX
MAAFTAALGWTLLGPWGLLVGAAFVTLLAAFTPRLSSRLELYVAGARPIAPDEASGLYDILAWLAERAELPAVPRLYLVNAPVPTALTVGSPRRASVAITPLLLTSLTPREVTNVFAHELSHIRNRDTRLLGFGDLLHRITRFFSTIGWLLLLLNVPLVVLGEATIPWLTVLLLVVAPNVNALLILALSRTREHDADAGAIELTGDPEGLASALVKVEVGSRPWWYALLPGGRPAQNPLLQTHPATEERLSRIRAMPAHEVDAPPFALAPPPPPPPPRGARLLFGPPRL